MEYPVFSWNEKDENNDIKAIDGFPDNNLWRYKLLCKSLTESIKDYKELFYETEIFETYEIVAMVNSINYIKNLKNANK